MMDTAALHDAIKICLKQINSNMTEASRIARAAEACAEAGSIAQALEVSMDIEQLLFDANRLHDAICLMNRIAQD